ncbi:bifunctional glycosyltransferase family 2 protein/CDP-glycerol:glycerophosphate glycerophosphotransferase [Isoptericola sp. BMS4]|uniref:bifunctional glycosyltransferase/CDP-glycerol:glycerophosphate glycerophosphotransferase n=1 Tax=Isoptericola sp. BMS4 TaxID=2527875 RepID=UPI001421C358|nr:bifunctional glycosyltransferase family 2 protein/CDP-glycerol:glycerophosphate glycerophosphotransferase [Isoptericola sp. BMS4]
MSVVVPVYKVEDYVGECLESILAQTHRRIEVVVVDDGSPDSSIDVINAVAARDRRVRVVRQENAGLGAARNTGVRNARGEMLCFVDSDDTVPPNAIEVMLTSLMRSGSDFAVGSLLRDTSTGMHMPPWARSLHDRTRTGVTIADEPEVLKNVFAWTKLFRTEFFHRVVGGFPDGLYEDQVPSAKAYLHGRFDVLQDVVCHWRIRDDESSITQQKSTMRDLTGRWAMLDELHEVMRDAPAAVRQAWEAKVVGFDMRPYYEQVPRTEDDYWTFLRQEVRGFLDMAGYERLAEVRVADRLLAAATYHGLRDDVVELVSRRESRTWKVHGVVREGRAVVGDDYFVGLGLTPDGTVERLDGDLDVVADVRVDQVLADERSLAIEGNAFLSQIDLRGTSSTVTVEAVPADGSGAVRVHGAVERFEDPTADLRAVDPWNDHAGSGFRATFALADLVAESYSFVLTVTVDGASRETAVPQPDVRGRGRLPAFGPLGDDGRWILDRLPESGDLVLRRHVAPRTPVRAARVRAGALEVELAGPAQGGIDFVARCHDSVVRGVPTREGDRDLVVFTLPRTPADGPARTWRLAARRRGAPESRLSWVAASSGLDISPGSHLVVGTTRFGNVVVQTAPLAGEIEDVELTPSGLRVRGHAAAAPGLGGELVLALTSEKAPGSEVTVPVDADGRFDVTVPVVDRVGNVLTKSSGFLVTLAAGDRVARPRAARPLVARLPLDVTGGGLSATVTATPKAGSVWVRLRAALDDEDRSRRDQERMQEDYREGPHAPLDAVVFESFGGRTIGDSPLALSRELHRRGDLRPQYWSVACLSTPVPEWATPVLRYSRRWYELLARATLLVNNNNWPWFFRKRSHQTYVQTWHGTPLKRIGNDVPGANLTVTYRRLMEREATTWDYLLAQNDYSARIFPSAFGYDGPVLTQGYPRNDSLVDGTADITRAEVRKRLGLGDDARVLLYAPTWRDNIKEGARYGRVAFLDFDRLAEATGPGTVVLYRGHANTASSSSDLPDGVLDVTHHPDVNELMLASDALVTDYSSIMFDYAVLRRPIYFLVPDLELYGTTTRGFYRELEEIAPGPLCLSTEELATALERDYWAAHGEDHSRFAAEFAPSDDGRAAARVLEAVTAPDDPSPEQHAPSSSATPHS